MNTLQNQLLKANLISSRKAKLIQSIKHISMLLDIAYAKCNIYKIQYHENNLKKKQEILNNIG